jgi:hypothetical protein
MQIANLVPLIVSLLLSFLVFRYSATPKAKRRNLLLLGLTMLALFGLAGCGPNAIQSIQAIIATASGIVPIVAAAGAAVDPAEAGKLTAAANALTASLQTLLSLVKTYQSSPSDTTLQKVRAGVTSVEQNLSALESAAHIKDAATQRKLANVITGAGLGLSIVEAAILATHPQTIAEAQQSQSG